MASKSPLNIVEDALAAALDAEVSLDAYQVFKGQSTSELHLPSIIISCDGAVYPPDLPQGLGNYLCRVSIGIFNSIDDDTVTTHREGSQNVMGVMNSLATIKASFNALGHATCYHVPQTSLDPDQGERVMMTKLGFDVLICLTNT